MKVQVYYVGKTTEKFLREGEAIYQKRLGHYLPISFDVLPDIRGAGKLSSGALKHREGDLILGKVKSDDGLILLDEGGKTFTSKQFATWIDKQLQMPYRRLIFVVGGAFGFDDPGVRTSKRPTLAKPDDL